MGWLFDALPLPYPDAVVAVGAAFLGICAGVLGTTAVLRQRSLVGDALAHAALPGVAIAFLITGVKDLSILLIGAAIAGLVGALLMVGIERTSRIRPDAAIGVVLSSFFSLGIVLITFIGHSNNANQAGLETFIFGQAAGLLEGDVNTMALLTLVGVAVVALLFRPLKTAMFDGEFAGSSGLPVRLLDILTTALLVIAIIVGIRTVGAILMVSMLIVPAVAARQLTNRLALLLPLAGVIGAAVGVTGSLLSARAQVPTGPVIVLAGFAVVVLAVLFAPGRGVAWRARTLARDRRRALTEGVLLDIEGLMHAGPPPTFEELHVSSSRRRAELKRGLRDLDRAGLLERDGDRYVLTEAGAAAAHSLVEQRELWSAWLEHGWRIRLADAREPDPRDLRGSLGDEAVAQLERLATETP